MTKTRRHRSSSPFEAQFGFCRALRIGDVVQVAGTAPIGPDGKTLAPNDAAAQTRRCFEIAREALESLGADLGHVIRTRMFLTHIDDWQAVGEVHGEFFRDVMPVATMVEVSRLIDPTWRVEIEVEALVR
ncbi:MAG: RidA family protein [Planctomycetota bacterium]